MIDASSKPFAENIEITRKVVEYAHDHGVVVEAELGALAGIEDDVQVSAEESHYTCLLYTSESIGQSVTTVATGGNAPRILRYCKRPIQYDADLIMLSLIHI